TGGPQSQIQTIRRIDPAANEPRRDDGLPAHGQRVEQRGREEPGPERLGGNRRPREPQQSGHEPGAQEREGDEESDARGHPPVLFAVHAASPFSWFGSGSKRARVRATASFVPTK